MAVEVICFLLGCAFEALLLHVIGVFRDTRSS